DQRPDHHEARNRGKKDVVELEGEQPPDDANRYEENQKPVGEARQRLVPEIAPPRGKPAERSRYREVAPPEQGERNRCTVSIPERSHCVSPSACGSGSAERAGVSG